ncbi:MAG: hypothetical protein ACWIPJ_11480 [Polaribacter sp.]
MDKQLQSKKKMKKKILLWGIPTLILIGIITLSVTRKKQVNLEKNTIRIGKVIKGDFEDVVLFNSTVKPKTSVLVNVI